MTFADAKVRKTRLFAGFYGLFAIFGGNPDPKAICCFAGAGKGAKGFRGGQKLREWGFAGRLQALVFDGQGHALGVEVAPIAKVGEGDASFAFARAACHVHAQTVTAIAPSAFGRDDHCFHRDAAVGVVSQAHRHPFARGREGFADKCRSDLAFAHGFCGMKGGGDANKDRGREEERFG